jgi:cell division transport system permease protein
MSFWRRVSASSRNITGRDSDDFGGTDPDIASLPTSRENPLVPRRSIAGRSLVAVIAIMAFLASIAAGATEIVARTASEWTSDLIREITVQVRPVAGRDIESDVTKAAEVARSTPGVTAVRVPTRAEIERLLEPWLGKGLDLVEIPLPRLVVLEIDRSRAPAFAQLREDLARVVPGASLDDHRFWLERLSSMAGTLAFVGVGMVALIFAAAALAVTFATRAAVSSSKDIVEILHLVGADDHYIAREYQSRFLLLGAQGAAIGGIAALLFYIAAGSITERYAGGASADQIEALFGSFGMGMRGYVVVCVVAVSVALSTAVVSRVTVHRHLKAMT